MGSAGEALIRRDSTPVAGWSDHAQRHGLYRRWTSGYEVKGRCVSDARNESSIAENRTMQHRKDHQMSVAFARYAIWGTRRIRGERDHHPKSKWPLFLIIRANRSRRRFLGTPHRHWRMSTTRKSP